MEKTELRTYRPAAPAHHPQQALRTCPLCEALCGLRLTLDNGHVTSVRGDPDDVFSKGFICPKGASLGALDEDPDRLHGPLVDGKPATWDEAFRVIADRLPGNETAVYLGNPNAHTMAGPLYAPLLIKALGTRNIYSASTADQMPKHVACGLMYGDPLAIPVPDLDRTGYLLMLGANPLESNGSLCTAPDFPGRLKALRRRGGKLVVLDPRRTRTADLADEHVFIRPGTDAYFLAGLAHTLFAEDLVTADLPVNGLDEVRSLVAGFAPSAVSAVTGVAADVIVRLARELAEAEKAAVYGRIGTCTQSFGTLAQWLVDVLNIITGNLDREGGAMFPRPAHRAVYAKRRAHEIGRWHSRIRKLPEANSELPVATLADEIETPGDGQVRALITIAGNPVLSAPNGARLDRALRGLDFMVSVDPYVNETTRHADVILPPPRMLQTGHYDFALLGLAVRNVAKYSAPVLPLEPGRPSEAEILARLAMIASGQGPDADPALVDEMALDYLLGKATAVPGSPVEGRDTAELKAALHGEAGAERRLDAMLRLGPYGDWGGGPLTFAVLRDHPHGIDLGPLTSRIDEVLATASGRIELAPPEIAEDVVRLRTGLSEVPSGLTLIGRRHLRSNNSWLHNVPALVGGSNTCTLQINPADADRLGLDGEARVRSAAGELTVPVERTDAIMPGVVSLPHGWGHEDSSQAVASRHPGHNVNVLTDETVIEPLSGNAVFNGVPVTVSSANSPRHRV